MLKINLLKNYIFLIFGFLFIIFWLYPLWNMQGLAIIGDGNLNLAGLESFKKSILEYNQWPQNDPWQRGGRPMSVFLISPLSIKFWFSIIFEIKTALSLYLLFCFMILFYGSYKIVSFYTRNKILQYCFAFLGIFNVALIFHLKAGHYIFLSFCYFPLVLYFLFRHRTLKFAGVFSGYFFALMLDDDIGYMPVYCLLILGIFIIYFFLNFKNNNRKKLLYWIYFFILTTLCIVGYKLSIFFEISQEFPRQIKEFYFSNIFSLIKSYLIPYYELTGGVFSINRFCNSTWENSVYIGLIAFIFIFYSFKNKLSLTHYIVIFLFSLQLGTVFFLPYGLLMQLPVFESHLCYNRIRLFNSFYLSFLIILGYIFISRNEKLEIYKFRNYILIFILIERLFTSHILMLNTHKNYKELDILSKHDDHYKNYSVLEKFKDNKKFFNYSILPPLEALKNNIGVMRYGGDPNFYYSPYGSANYVGAYASDEKEYRGEFVLNNKIIEPDFWSPNIIIFNNLELGKTLKLNMNPNRGWKINSKDLLKTNKIWEPNKEFIIKIEDSSITLEYDQPGKRRGVIITFLSLFLFLISIFKFRDNKL